MYADAGNLSIFDSESGLVWIIAAGKDKSKLTIDDFISISLSSGNVIGETVSKPCVETPIHRSIFSNLLNAACVLHVHTVDSCVLKFHLTSSNRTKYQLLPNIETIKTFGNFTEKSNPSFLVLHNHEDALEICKDFSQNVHNNPPQVPFFLVEKHGITVWGKNVYEANKNLEAVDFILRVMVSPRMLST
jgi:methylthioribulose-1-phosphate dehydratase